MINFFHTAFTRCVLLSSIVFSAVNCFAQDTTAANTEKNPSRLRMGVGTAANVFIGDVSDSFEKFYPALTLSFQFDSKKRITTQLNVTFGKVAGDNPSLKNLDGKTPNTYFQSSYLAFDFRLKYNFRKTKKLSPFLSAGAGYMSFSPRDQNGSLFPQSTRPNDYPTTTFILPLSLGINYKLNPASSLHIQANIYNPQTDYLDNVSKWGTKKGKDNLLGLQISFVMDPLPYVMNVIAPAKNLVSEFDLDEFGVRTNTGTTNSSAGFQPLAESYSFPIQTIDMSRYGISENITGKFMETIDVGSPETMSQFKKIRNVLKENPAKTLYITLQYASSLPQSDAWTRGANYAAALRNLILGNELNKKRAYYVIEVVKAGAQEKDHIQKVMLELK